MFFNMKCDSALQELDCLPLQHLSSSIYSHLLALDAFFRPKTT